MKHGVKMVQVVRMVWVCSSFLALLSCVDGIGGPINTVAAADSPNVIVIFVDNFTKTMVGFTRDNIVSFK